MVEPARVYLSLGSNINRQQNITSALNSLATHFGEVRISPVYESESVGFDGSPFYNLVALIHTTLGVGDLVDTLHAIEEAHGRTRDRKSTRLNSSHVANSYAVFSLKTQEEQTQE